MAINVDTLPVSGQVIVIGALWAGLSALALGPWIAARETERAGWGTLCPATIAAEIDAKRPVISDAPDLGCDTIAGLARGFVPQGDPQALCDSPVGSFFDEMTELARAIDPAARADEAARMAQNRVLDRAAGHAETACACAASVVASDRLRWAVHAGSLRLAGQGTDNLISDLTGALHSPACAVTLGG